ncbi:MAG TPA: fumarylacetoacetate hydrolase family protein [Abditibacterium sp.]|jgi:2-keto-4-pentenoate hydratase/2-oxohepta-3-ene-1,7-dioic acid hydratase in catechol pathway
MPIYGQFFHQGAPRHAEIEILENGEEIAHFIADLFQNPARNGESAPVSELQIMVPVSPQKLFAIGLNYADHAAEHGNAVPELPLMWFKAPTALLPHQGEVEIAFPDHRTDFEAELAIVIGKRGKRIAESEAHDYIFGVTCAQDISDRVIQRSESQWARAKSLDTYAPLGPYIYTGLDLADLTVQTLVNGEIKQNGHTRDMIFSPARIVSFLSEAITLEAGDVILTGTPEGVGALRDGDALETRIGNMKPLQNRAKFVV